MYIESTSWRISYDKGMGTALWNESAGEAVHADFDKFYRDFIVKDLNSTVYNHKLLKAVKLYNVSHI